MQTQYHRKPESFLMEQFKAAELKHNVKEMARISGVLHQLRSVRYAH